MKGIRFMPNAERLMLKIKKFSQEVDAFLIAFIRRDCQIPNLHDALLYALGLDEDDPALRGKRLRPALGMMVAETLGVPPRAILPIAAAVELFHNFTLIHDDIEDGDAFRRNRPCVYMKYGLSHGVNIGDFMLIKAYRALLEKTRPPIKPTVRLSLLELMTDVFERTHVGQALDISARNSHTVAIDEYMTIVEHKTGFCLAAPMIAAALLAGASRAVRGALQSYAKAIGPLFQIRDDVIDLTKGKGRKEVGSDIREGKRSFLVAHVSSLCTETQRRKLYKILDVPRHETSDADINWVASLFKKYGSLQAAEEKNRELLDSAFQAIKRLPAPLKELLAEFADLLVRREK